MERRGLGTAIGDGQTDQNVIGRGFGVLDEHVEVTVLVEHTRVGELELVLLAATTSVLFDEPPIRILRLCILIEGLHVGVGGCRIEVVVTLLHIFPVITLRIG
jgi:hypothetical protein